MKRYTLFIMIVCIGMCLCGWLNPVWAESSQGIDQGDSIPVLCYHRFGNYGDKDIYSISTAEFEEQLEIIQQEQMTPITVTQLSQSMLEKKPLPERPVLITVDDGYRDFLSQAKPLLEKYGYSATLFVYTDFVGSRLGLKPNELKTLQADGFDIGSHSASHPRLNQIRAGETEAQRRMRLRTELKGSRDKLRTWTQSDVLGLAYPYGLWNNEVAEIAQAAGYTLLFSVNPGTNTLKSEKKCLKRNMVLRGTRKQTFRAMLTMRELTIVSWQPPLGEPVQGSLDGLSLVVDPALQANLAPQSIRVMAGRTVIPSRYDEKSGQLDIRFAKPWTHGTDLIVLTAQDHKGMLHYKQSRLIQLVPSK